ncbi:MAG TPA: aminotransferase class V-fold PLP-dependent enzyme, partial [Thermomicrobiales bacterium]|nr:aminotransferase class V-fold PLP-dependent enzyme [Thermomicrobiales bacterium]
TDPRSIYDRIGVRKIINGRGATTAVGGTLLWPEALAAMAEAAQAFVVLDELNDRVGEKIARLTGAEAGYVTSGSAAGMALAAAACIAGNDPELIRRLPDSDGLRNEIVIHRCQRIDYDQMFRVGGGKLVEIGLPYETRRWELERAIGARTAAVAWIDSPNTSPGALDFDAVVALAHARGVPVIVDAASTLPPVDHLRRWIRWGADLVIYSGGKGIRGPQDSGLLAGRRDLIDAARANGNPHAGIGRGMKVSKEAMAGLWVALDRFMAADHDAEYREHLADAEEIAAALAGRSDAHCQIEAEWEDWPAPVVRVLPLDDRWRAADARDRLQAGEPSIHVAIQGGGLLISTHCLAPGDAATIAGRLAAVLDGIDESQRRAAVVGS